MSTELCRSSIAKLQLSICGLTRAMPGQPPARAASLRVLVRIIRYQTYHCVAYGVYNTKKNKKAASHRVAASPSRNQ